MNPFVIYVTNVARSNAETRYKPFPATPVDGENVIRVNKLASIDLVAKTEF